MTFSAMITYNSSATMTTAYATSLVAVSSISMVPLTVSVLTDAKSGDRLSATSYMIRISVAMGISIKVSTSYNMTVVSMEFDRTVSMNL